MRNSFRIANNAGCSRESIHLFKGFIRAEIHAAKHATLERIIVEDNSVVLVISVERHDGHDEIYAVRHEASA